jgi:hypothetical protein
VATSDTDAAEEELGQQMERSGVAGAILLRETAGTTRAILHKRLSEHFRSVQVDVRPAARARGVQFRFYEGFGSHPKTSIVRMTATRAGGGPTVAEGRGTDKIWGGHLAWMIPACAATGLIPCVIWIPYAGKALHDGARERALAYGIDQAASQLAARLARQADGAPGEPPSYEVQVSAAPPAASPPEGAASSAPPPAIAAVAAPAPHPPARARTRTRRRPRGTSPTPEPAPATAGRCTRDTDCKGVRICNQGRCAFPRRAAPPPPPPPAGAACTRDTECKGVRICHQGRCTFPSRPRAHGARRRQLSFSKGNRQ